MLAGEPDSADGPWGFSITDEAATLRGIVEQATVADRLGCSMLVGAESDTSDGVTVAATVAAATSRALIATGVLNVYSRTPFTLAQTAASLQELSGGRFVLGLGASSAALVRGAHAIPYDAPISRVRETVLATRALLRGERVATQDGTPGIRLRRLPPSPVPILLAALGPRMTDLAAEIADYVLLALTSPEGVSAVAERIRDHGRSVRVAARLLVPWPGDSPDALAAVRQTIAVYAQVPAYAGALTAGGHEQDVRRIAAEGARAGLSAAADAVSEALLADRAVVGTAAEQRSRLALHRRAGCDVPVLAIETGQLAGGDRGAAVAEALQLLAHP